MFMPLMIKMPLQIIIFNRYFFKINLKLSKTFFFIYRTAWTLKISFTIHFGAYFNEKRHIQFFCGLAVLRIIEYYLYLLLQFSPPFLNRMRRQVTHQNFGRVYREFSRQRYNKYSHQFPRMREAEIVLKIIKEWEHMDEHQKSSLSQRYKQHKYIPEEQEKSNSNFSSAHKTPVKNNKTTLPTTQKSKPHPTASRPSQQSKRDEDSQFNRFSEKRSEEQRSDKSSYSLLVMPESSNRQHKADLPKNHQYIIFYKYHYAKLSKEHQKWNSLKISQIIKLLWMRRQRLIRKPMFSRSKKIAKMPKQKPNKTVTGRILFRKLKVREGLSPEAIKAMWKRQPLQTRNWLCRQGQGEPVTTQVKAGTMVFRSSSITPGCPLIENHLQFMRKPMM